MNFHFGLTCLREAAVTSSTLFVLPLKFYVKKFYHKNYQKLENKKALTFFSKTHLNL